MSRFDIARQPVASKERVSRAIASAADRTGVDFDYLMNQARVESGFRADAKVTTSSASGLFQFTQQTWLATVKQHRVEHNYSWAAGAISVDKQGQYSVPDTECRALLAERIPLRDFRRVAEAMVDAGGQELSLADLVEAVRQRIGALIVQGIVPVKMPLPAITFDPELEALLTQAVRTGPQTSWPFEPELARQIIAAIGNAVSPLLLAARSFAVITSPVCRAAVSRLLRAQFADVAVLSFLEIPETKAVEIIATISGKKAAAMLSDDSDYEKEE